MAISKTVPFYISRGDPPAKQKILSAALKLFSKNGLAATSIRDIAQESGYTNPALYKHFPTKEKLALYLFERCHQQLWTSCSSALASGRDFRSRLDAYIGIWLEFLEEYPEALAFLSDSARVLWPKSNETVRRHTMIDLARSIFRAAHLPSGLHPDVLAACLQGTLAELGRMIQLGVVKARATRWRTRLVALFCRLTE
jgi:AcrR family transcriptional regulator